MLIPKRVKRRRQHRGTMKGKATKGNVIAYGEYGLVSEELGWIKSNQIEAARIERSRPRNLEENQPHHGYFGR